MHFRSVNVFPDSELMLKLARCITYLMFLSVCKCWHIWVLTWVWVKVCKHFQYLCQMTLLLDDSFYDLLNEVILELSNDYDSNRSSNL